MLKVSHSATIKLILISELRDDDLLTYNKTVFVNLCQCALSSIHKFQVQQHIQTRKHQGYKYLNSKQRHLIVTQTITSN